MDLSHLNKLNQQIKVTKRLMIIFLSLGGLILIPVIINHNNDQMYFYLTIFLAYPFVIIMIFAYINLRKRRKKAFILEELFGLPSHNDIILALKIYREDYRFLKATNYPINANAKLILRKVNDAIYDISGRMKVKYDGDFLDFKQRLIGLKSNQELTRKQQLTIEYYLSEIAPLIEKNTYQIKE